MKDFRITEKDLYEFNAWIKNRLPNEPRIRSQFKSDKDYEEYMINYMDTHITLETDPAVIDKRYSDNDQYKKEAIRLIKIRNNKISDKDAEAIANFGFDLAFKSQDFIDVLKETLKKEGKKFSEIEGVKCDWPDGVYQVSYDDFMVVNSIDNQMKLTYETEEFGDEEFDGTLTVKDGIAKLVKNAVQSFSEREKVSAEMLERAKTEGVVQKKPNGAWGIISIDKGEWWTPDYETEEKANNALKAYHSNKGFSTSYKVQWLWKNGANKRWNKDGKEFKSREEANRYIKNQRSKYNTTDEDVISQVVERKFSFAEDGTLSIFDLVGMLLHSIADMHIDHLTTNDYATHMALEDYYENMPELVDAFAENSLSNLRIDDSVESYWYDEFPKIKEGTPIEYLSVLKDYLEKFRKDTPTLSDSQKSDLDAIEGQINSTLYKLQRLTSQRTFTLK